MLKRVLRSEARRDKVNDILVDGSTRQTRLPPELWISIASYLDDETLKGLISINRVLFSLAMDAKYRSMVYSTMKSNTAAQALSYFVSLLNHLRDSGDQVAPRVRQICTEGDLLERLVPPPDPSGGGTTLGRRLLSNIIIIGGKKADPVITCQDVRSAFENFRNVERMDITFNGWRPGMSTVVVKGDPNDLMNSIYSMEPLVHSFLDAMCRPFYGNLRELQIALDNRHRVRFVLRTPVLAFPRLEVLHLRLYRNIRFQEEPWDEVFTDFICQFSESLCVLKLRISGPGPCPLDILLGGGGGGSGQVNFPRLHTLEIRSHTSYESSRGLPRLNAFFTRTPRLKNFSILGACFERHEQLPEEDTIRIPPHIIQLSSFGTSEEIWRTHHTHLTPIFNPGGTLKKLVIQLDLHIAGRQRLFDKSFNLKSAGSPSQGPEPFLTGIEELHLQMVELNINNVVVALGELFPRVHTLVIECEFVQVHRAGTHHGSFDAQRHLSGVSIQRLIASSKHQLQNPHHPLHSLDIIRKPREYTADNDQRISFCSCPEVRLWGAMKVFVQCYFPSIKWVGGGGGGFGATTTTPRQVYPAELIDEAIRVQNQVDFRGDMNLCMECVPGMDLSPMRGRGNMPRISRWGTR